MRRPPDQGREESRRLAYIGENLRELRRVRGVSQELLEARSGVSQDQISRIEGGERRPTVAQLVALAGALGCSPGVLLREGRTSGGGA